MADKRYMGEEKEKNHLLSNIAKTGSLKGGGVMAYRNFPMIGKSDALGETAYVSRKLRGGFDGNIQEKMYKKLENYVRRNIKKKQMLKNHLAQNNIEFVNRYYKEFHKRNMWGFNKFEYAATQSFRQNKILENLLKLSSIKNNGGDKILNALIQYHNQNKGIFNSPADYINDFIKQLENGKYAPKVKFLDDTQRNVFQKQMLQTLEWYQDIKKVFEENKGTILSQAKTMETASTYEFIQDAINQTDVLMTRLKKTGFNYTTLKDAEKLDTATKRKYGLIIDDIDEKGNEKSIDVTGELRKFLDNNKHNDDLNALLGKKGISFVFENMILDSNLYTHAKTGEIIDNRHLKAGAVRAIDSFQESIKVPFFINSPMDLKSWQAFYSSLSKEELQVVDSEQFHRFVSNLDEKGFDSVTKTNQEGYIRNPLNNSDHFYTGGNVFPYTESGVRDLINEGSYLASSQFGTFSRMDKSYARSGYKKELTGRDASQLYEDTSVKELGKGTWKYINLSEGFISLREAAVEKSLPTLMEFMIPTFGEDVVRIPAIEKLRRSFHQFALRALDNEASFFTQDVVKKDARNKRILSELDIKNMKGLDTLTEFQGYDNIHTIDARPREAKILLEDVMNNDKGKVEKEIVSDFNINNLKNYGAIDNGWDLAINTKMNASNAASTLVEQELAVSKDRLVGRHTYRDALANVKNSNQDIEDIGRIDELSDFLKEEFYTASKLGNIYGFLTKTGVGYKDSWRGKTLVSSILRTYPRHDFLVANHGSALPGIGRRYVSRGLNKVYYSPIRNKMSDCLTSIIGESTDLLLSDQIQKNEIKLLGKVYETLVKHYSDGIGSDEFVNDVMFNRFPILAETNPNSGQYKVAKHQIPLLRQSGGFTENMDKEFDEITKLIQDNQDTYYWYDKKFSNADIQEKSGTGSKIIDANTFMVREFDTPVKLTQKDNRDVIYWMEQYFKLGEKDKIGFTRDLVARKNNNTYGSMDAVVYTNRSEDGHFGFKTSKGQSFNALIGNRIWKNPFQISDDGSSTSTKAFNLNNMVAVGKYSEMLTHDIVPKMPFAGILDDKFLQERTPIESYKRDQVYDSDWGPWPQPYEGWINTMINTVVSQNPIITGEEMTAIGAGRILSRLGNVAVPQVREGEREINQHFNRLSYVKYYDLYEKSSKLAQSKEGESVEEFFDDAARRRRNNIGLKRYLTDKKKTLSWAKKMGYGDTEAVKSEIDELSDGLGGISSTKETNQAGKYIPLAIKYRQEYEGTLYSMGETEDSGRRSLRRTLTPKGKKYIPQFLETTSSKEGQEILQYVPEDTKEISQDSWGLRVDKQEDIEDYFNTHYLPAENWTGWNASTNLDGIKIKVMQKKGINPTTSGYWSKDQARAEKTGEKEIQIHPLSSLINIGRLRDVLLGMGLSDVDVQLTTSYGEGPGGINTSIDIMKDVKNEILDGLNAGVHSSLF
ncbi:TPA: hypothetical protein QCX75_001176 [Bacillus mycoides]|uniref:hypothetical protein n=1 Tax=Bacillus sp. FSL P2-0099 TaxID=2921572 RepID=UPI0030F9CBCF|nr:hypothetical protein [Bacillus mycoides]